jgi:hypothetical protein
MALLSFPDEILCGIFATLVPPVVERLGTYADTLVDPKETWVLGRVTLLSLTKVCKRLRILATPWLYRSVYLSDGTNIVKLLRTVLERPHVTSYVVNLGLIARLDWTNVQADIITTYEEEDWTTLAPSPPSPFTELLSNEMPIDDEFGEVIFAILVSRLSRLHSLLLYVPSQDEDCYEIFLDTLESSAASSKLPLASLFRLIIVVDPEEDSPTLDSVFVQRLLAMGQIRSLELFGDTLQQSMEGMENINDETAWTQLEEITLEFSHTTGKGWYELCRRCSKLKAVRMSLSPYCEANEDDLLDYRLNNALLMRASTLESVSIEDFARDGLLEQFGPDGWLSCLPHMISLKNLEVELASVFKTTTGIDTKDIRSILPSSIERITLFEVWQADEETAIHSSIKSGKQEYSIRICSLLENLVLYSKEKLPSLKLVKFLSRHTSLKSGTELKKRSMGVRAIPDDVVFIMASIW